MVKNQAQGRRAYRKAHVKWETVKWEDWPSNKKLAVVMGVSPEAVGQWRRKLAPHTLGKRIAREFMDSLDWSKANWELEKETGIPYQALANYRHSAKKQKPLLERRKPKICKIPWGKVDWSKRDAEIARDLGCSRCAVGLKRRALAGNPRSRWKPHERRY